ncbi:hypothetical protein MAC_08702 [Metarhizium acridum CQMa 102]|uniref:Uncharacterized protein n=1 Tax=Metarhizium acridum (strain CQMa 102) TaxID=655827 RepID=E9EFQ4_METAQ|nr:uncharacterized protein MAC_08702 [Metarhizium acridum CQMa 102]EFY85242.1 hypothetical protein MAC_08702 [Metarhizium acridum CQMa 102]
MVSVSLLVNVGKWVASFAVKAAWKSLSQNDAGHATEILRGISTGQHEVARQIENLSIKVEILDSMRRILYWSKRMDEVMDDFKKLNGGQINATDLAYVELLSALRDENLAETDAERLYKEFHDQVTTISNTLLKLYPPGLRFLKPSLEDAGSQDGSQWLKWQQADNSNHHLVMHNFYIPVLGSAREPIQTKKPEAWQFALQQNEEPLGAMQFLSAWENKGNKRLRYSKKYQQGWSINFSTSKNRDTSAILFKLIPLEGKKPEFRFVPYLEGSMGIVSDKKRTFDWKFVAVAE